MLSLTSSVISEISISDKACDFDSVGKALENSAQSEVKLNNHFRMMQKLKTAKQKVSYCLQQVSLVAGKSTANGGYSIHFGKAEMKAMTGLSQRTIGSTFKELVKDKSITFLYPGSYWISKDIVNKKF
jgi:CRP-like cAMP-binding protein